MKLAIVEDEAVHGRLLEQYIMDWGKQNDIPVIIKIYPGAESFLFAWEDEPAEKGFVKCHRSYLCNIANLNGIASEVLVFDDGMEIPVSRRLYKTVNRVFIDRFGRRDG